MFKKYKFISVTLFTILFCIIAYNYEYNISNNPILDKVQPNLGLYNEDYGDLQHTIFLSSNNLENPPAILAVYSKEIAKKNHSFFYALDLKTNTLNYINFYESHNYLYDKLLKTSYDTFPFIYNFSNKGLIENNLSYNTNVERFLGNNTKQIINNNLIDISSTSDILIDDDNSYLFYTKPNKKFLYKSELYGSDSMYNHNAYLKNPKEVFGINNSLKKVYYSRETRNGTHLYASSYDDMNKNELLLKHIFSLKKSASQDMASGFYGDSREYTNLNLFIYTIGNKIITLDKFPFIRDCQGAAPYSDSILLNSKEVVIYTKYNKDGTGEIKIASPSFKPKTILKDKNLFGPISSMEYDGKGYILFYTKENNKTKIKILNLEDNKFEDITSKLHL